MQVPSRDYNFHRTLMDRPWRQGLKPLDIVQVGWCVVLCMLCCATLC